MARWSSYDELATALGLAGDPSDRESIATEIRREMASLHPDRNGGAFDGTEQTSRYHRLSEALDFLTRGEPTGMVRIAEVTALVAAVKQAIEMKAPTHSALEARAEYRDVAKAERHQRLILPRISSGAFAAACGLLLAISDKLKDDLLLGRLVASDAGRAVISMFLIYSAVFFAMTWWMEQRAAAEAEWLATEGGRKVIFSVVLRGVPSTRFPFSRVVQAIMERSARGGLLWPIGGGMSASVAEHLAKAHLDDLEARGIVRKVSSKTLDATYEMESVAAAVLRGAAER